MVLSSDQIYFVLCLILSVPSSILFKSFPAGTRFDWIKHTFSIVWSFLVYRLLFSNIDYLICLIPVILVWIAAKMMNKYPSIKGHICITTWIGCIGFLSALHINRMTKYWYLNTIDSTTVHMMITIKLTQFITDKYKHSERDKHNPSFLEWMGFIYFIPSLLAGPVLTFEEYINFIIYSRNSETKDETRKKINQCWKLLPKALGLVTMAIIGFIWYSPFYMISESFSNLSFTRKLLYMYISMLLLRCKYYFVWTISEIAYVISGASPFVTFRGRNVDILQVEFASNTHSITNGWNKKTNEWLKTSVYQTLAAKGYAKHYCIITTNLISAVWHGFYPGYYITFILGGTCTFIGRIWRKHVSSYVNKTQHPIIVKIYNFSKIPIMMLILSFCGMPFNLYSLKYSLKAYNELYWVGPIIIALGLSCILIGKLFVRFTNVSQMLSKNKKV